MHRIMIIGWLALFFFGDVHKRDIHIRPSRYAADGDTLGGLKDYYRDYFTMGVAVSPRSLHTDEAGFILKHFSSLTPENAMKMGPIHPLPDRYNWRDADSIVAFAFRNGMRVRGHALCWHNQTPHWLFVDARGDTVGKTELLSRLREHIHSVVSRYKGKIYAWDVVNEAISDRADKFYRNSAFYRICGEEYIEMAFEYAHEADPAALLFYNDYNTINPVKRKKIIRMVRDLRARGVPVQAIGLQGHWAITEPGREQLDETLRDFASLGLPLQITELDISVYPKEHMARERRPADSDTVFTAERAEKQAGVYRMCFELFRKYRQSITGVTFWNISDRQSWLDNFPVRGRKDYPLLFDRDLNPKAAYWEVVNFKPSKR